MGASKRGFTLIELSIVLVIIGLIVGGVLVGKDLIKAAEIRATIGQIDKYNTAVHTFEIKYSAIPGDIYYTKANELGFFTCGAATGFVGQVGYCDGNGLVESEGPGGAYLAGETGVFWRQLSEANLIDGAFGSTLNDYGYPDSGPFSLTLPTAKLGRNLYFAVYAIGAANYFEINGQNMNSNNYQYNVPLNSPVLSPVALTPLEAYNIDLKIDDGLPLTGAVTAAGANVGDPVSGPVLTGTGNQYCVTAATPGTYNVTGASGNVPACGLRTRLN